MVKEEGLYLVDATPFFDRTHKTFLRAPLLLAGANDNTFVYGFLREFLLLRNDLRITAGIVVISCDCHKVASEQEIQNVIGILKKLGVSVVISEKSRAVDLCHKYALRARAIYTENDALLQFASDDRNIVKRKARSEYEFLDSASVKRKYSIEPDKIATFLALTRGQKDTVISKNQAIRLIESIGKLEQIFAKQREIPTLGLQTKIKDNTTVISSRYQQLTPSAYSDNHFIGAFPVSSVSLDTEGNVTFLKKMGLYSLTRRLNLPDSSSRNYLLVPSRDSNYEIIDNEKALQALKNKLLETEMCVIDTEASSKDSHSAVLFGIAFSNGKWKCYVPFLDQDLKGISAKRVLREIKRALEDKNRKYIGHNIKYDYVLLRRHGIHLKSIHFDTMLAAFECYGDLEFLNLGFLSEKLLGRGKSPYKEIIGKTDSPWESLLINLQNMPARTLRSLFNFSGRYRKRLRRKV